MKVKIVSQSDIAGGAARAAYRLHRALIAQGTDSQMRVRDKRSDDWTVMGAAGNIDKAGNFLRSALGNLAMRMQKSSNVNLHTGNWVPSLWAREINGSSADVVNLHWVAAEALSIEDIGRIRKPVIWTLHDMWPFSGAEHYSTEDEKARWRTGYASNNRNSADSGMDLDRLVWRRKQRCWKRPMHIVAPSSWLAGCAKESALFRNWQVSVIPNVSDTKIFQPLNRDFCRQALGLPIDRKIVMFGAMGGGRDPRKGYDLLLEALGRLAARIDVQNTHCVVFGQGEPRTLPNLPFRFHWLGVVHDDAALALLYNAADVMVVPSRQENLPQTATEAQTCGCPVVAFDCSGFRDVVVHKETGYLAKAFDCEEMAAGLSWILADAARRNELGRAARNRALQLWAPEVVVPQYLSVCRSMVEHG